MFKRSSRDGAATTIENDPARQTGTGGSQQQSLARSPAPTTQPPPAAAADGEANTPFSKTEAGLYMFGLTPAERGTKYNSAGGGEVVTEGTPAGFLADLYNYFRDEYNRPKDGYTMVIGPDVHSRPPRWMEEKNVAIDGTPLSEADMRQSPGHWMHKYKKELDIGEAVAEVKKQKRFELEHDVMASVGWLRRRLGFSVPLDEGYATQTVEARYRIQEDVERSMREEGGSKKSMTSSKGTGRPPSSSPKSALLFDDETLDAAAAEQHEKRTLGTAWRVLMESVETGRPLAKVAQDYRPRVDFYGIDPFLDSAPSVIWFSTKCGIAIGLFQGTVRAAQAINVDVQFLKASGVGVLSILNMSVFASVVKWGGNTAVFAGAFCAGDRLARAVKRRTLPRHDAEQRSTGNYVVGLACSGATVGVLPWWVLSDVTLAARLAVSGVFVGGVLGLVVGLTMERLVALNASRLGATNRQLRRYEALMAREREWSEREKEKHRSTNAVWW